MKLSLPYLWLIAGIVAAAKQGTSLPELEVADGEFKDGGLASFDMSRMLTKRACPVCYPWSCDGHCCQFDT